MAESTPVQPLTHIYITESTPVRPLARDQNLSWVTPQVEFQNTVN